MAVTKKPKLTPDQRALLTKTFAAMRRHVGTFDMSVWMRHEDGGKQGAPRPYCGTTACLAGHITLAAGLKPEIVDDWGDARRDRLPARLRRLAEDVEPDRTVVGVPDLALKLLGVPASADWEVEHCLFSIGGWPRAFQRSYIAGKTPRAKVNVAIARVRHWLKTGK